MTAHPQPFATATRRRLLRLGAMAILTLGAVIGCLGDKTISPALRSPAGTLGPGVASPMNSIIAVGETLSVTLHAKTLTGEPVTSFDSVTYVYVLPSDTQYVRISPAGVMTGMRATLSPVQIWMIAYKNGSIATDLAFVEVTDTALPAATLSIRSDLPDNPTWPVASELFLSPVIQDSITGDVVPNPQLRLEFGPGDSSSVTCFAFALSNPPPNIAYQATGKSVCTIQGGLYYNGLNSFVGLRPDTIWIYANVSVYGRMLRDSLQLTLTNPTSSYIYLTPLNLSGSHGSNTLNVSVAPGGLVIFANQYDPSYGTSFNITFDHPEGASAWPDTVGAPSGNITGLVSNGTEIRQFFTPGTYTYTFTIAAGVDPFKGVTGQGTITVQ